LAAIGFLKQHDAGEEPSLPAHVSRLPLDDFQFAFVEPKTTALLTSVDDHCVGNATLHQIQPINRTLARAFAKRVHLHPTFRAKAVAGSRRLQTVFGELSGTAKATLIVCHISHLWFVGIGDEVHHAIRKSTNDKKTVPPFELDGTVAITVSPFDGTNRIRFKGSPGLGIAEFGLRISKTAALESINHNRLDSQP
jgi:hypothetical protein